MKISFQCFHFLSFLLVTSNCIAQTERINTDRPDQTDGVYTIPANTFQIENGITIARATLQNNFMLRYGAGKSTEIRFAIDAGKEDGSTGIKPATFSLKQRFLNQKGAIPSIALIGEVSVGKFATHDFRTDEFPFVLKLSFENDLSEKFSIESNIGTSNKFRDVNFTLEGGYALSGNASIYLEYFSTFYNAGSEHNMDAGILYGITNRLQIDLAAGWSLNNNGIPWFTTAGISYFFD